MTQEERVYNYILEFGFINSMIAYEIGITQLGTRIFNLKKKGYRFYKKRRKGVNRYGAPTHWDDYFLVSPKPIEEGVLF